MRNRRFLKFLMGVWIAGVLGGVVACAPAASPTSTPTKAAAPAAASTPAAKASEASPSPAASDADVAAKLYEAAKKEGQVMAYGIGTDQEWAEFTAAFGKKYPGIKVEGFSGTSEVIREKIFTEARAGKPVADMVSRTAFEDISTYLKEGVLDKYLSPELKNFDQQYYDAQGLWAVHSYYIDLIEYNTQAIPKDQAPKGYADLLKPEFKGKLGLEASAFLWFDYMVRIMGKEKGLDYMKKLGEQKPRLITGHTALHKLVISGEIPVAVYMFNFRALPDKEAGAPIEWVIPAEVTPSSSLVLGIVKNAPHPNAARLLEDFMLSAEGAPILAKQGWVPVRKGADLGKLSVLSKVQVLMTKDPVMGSEIAASEQPFRDIFGKP